MFESIINKCLEDCLVELKNSSNPEIKEAIDNINSQVYGSDHEDIMESAMRIAIAQCMTYKLNKEQIDNIVVHFLNDISEHIPTLKSSYILSVKMKGLSRYIQREIEIPGIMSLDDLCMVVLASMNCYGSHMYDITYGGETFDCLLQEDAENYTAAYTLEDLELSKGDKLVLSYDYGEDYEFDILVKDIVEHDSFFNLEDMRVIKGKGYGIWEDNHYLLELYLKNREAFYAFLEENGIEEEFLPIEEEEEFQIEDMEDILGDYFTIKTAYEDID